MKKSTQIKLTRFFAGSSLGAVLSIFLFFIFVDSEFGGNYESAGHVGAMTGAVIGAFIGATFVGKLKIKNKLSTWVSMSLGAIIVPALVSALGLDTAAGIPLAIVVMITFFVISAIPSLVFTVFTKPK